jgi:hypothetical protein
MQNQTSKIINIFLSAAIIVLALNAYQMKQQINSQEQNSSDSINKINASLIAIKAHELEFETKDASTSALVADLIIQTQEQAQSIDTLLANQTKKK